MEQKPNGLVDLFTTLCSINAPPKQERAVVDYVKTYLLNLGLDVKEDDGGKKVNGNAGNVIATLPANIHGAPKIFFSSHFDTVEPNPGVKIIIEGDIIKTDGTTILGADDKAGMAPMLEAIRIVVENNLPHGQIQLVLTICEEIGLLGARVLDMSLVDSDFGFVYDSGPPVGSLINQTPTHDTMEVVITGKPSHAGVVPELGISAIEIAAKAIANMEVYIKAEARSRNKEKVDAQIAHMVQCFRQAADERGGQVEIKPDRHYEGYTLTEDFPPVKVALQAARKMGIEPALRPTGGGADANIFNGKGLPCVVVGCAMQKVHTHEEFARISDLEASVNLTLAIIETVANMRT